MSALTQKTLQAIARRNIRPIPLWVTRCRNGGYWVGAIFLSFLSAVVNAVSLHSLFEIDWDAYIKADFTWLQIIGSGVPFFSVILLIVFLWAAVWVLQQTRRGYRYPMTLLVGVFLLSSVALGYFIEESPLDEPTERFFLSALPHVDTLPAGLVPSAERQWARPERGLLGGTIVSSDAAGLQLIDASEKLWTVDYSAAAVSSGVSLDVHRDIKMIGAQEDETTFKASEIRVWKRSEQEERKKDRVRKKTEKKSEQGGQGESDRAEQEEERNDEEDSSDSHDDTEHDAREADDEHNDNSDNDDEEE
jgi:hypothetical protein